jgi:hypothetical protein
MASGKESWEPERVDFRHQCCHAASMERTLASQAPGERAKSVSIDEAQLINDE